MDEVTKNISLNDVQNIVNKVNEFDLTKIDFVKIKEFIFKDQRRACMLILLFWERKKGHARVKHFSILFCFIPIWIIIIWKIMKLRKLIHVILKAKLTSNFFFFRHYWIFDTLFNDRMGQWLCLQLNRFHLSSICIVWFFKLVILLKKFLNVCIL